MGHLAYILTLGLFLVVLSSAKSIEKRDAHISEAPFPPQKRPFCNAFTGCGRKRAENSMMSVPLPGENDSTLSRISNRLVAEARLWEMLQQRLGEAAGMADISNELSENAQLTDIFSSKRRKRSVPQQTENKL